MRKRGFAIVLVLILALVPNLVYAAESYTFHGGEGEVAVATLDGVPAVYNFDYIKTYGKAAYDANWISENGYNCASYVNKYYYAQYGIRVNGLGQNTTPNIYSGTGYFTDVKNFYRTRT